MVKSENKMSSKKDYSKGTLNGDIDLPSEEIIRRMKVLSKSQTAFLKAYLHRKLDHAKGLVQKTLEALSSSTDSDELSDLHKQLQKLHLDDIRVDVSSTELMMHEEMELLRKAINKNTLQPSSLPSSVDDGDDSKDSRVKVLESENANLRGLLKELKAELLNAGKRKDGDSPSTPVVDSEQSVKQSKEIERLKKELDQSKKSLQEKDEEVRAALEEVEALRSSGGNTESALAEHKAEIKALKTEMETLKQSSASGAEETGMLKKQIKELQDAIEDEKKATAEQVSKFNAEKKELEHKLQEVQKAAEQEKDDAMEAMTREIEDLVKKHSAETAAQAKETKKLQKALSKYKNSSKSLAGGLGAIRRNASELKASQKRLVTDTRDVIRGVQSEFSTTFTNGILGKLTKLDAMVGEVSKKYRKELSERKRLHNVIQELKGNIRVYLRARPPSAREIEQFGEETVCVSFPENGEVKVFNEKGREKTWEFDEVFDLQATQEKIYSEVSDLVTSVLDGYNVCIFAYGQTGSGKTFTMTGPPDCRGVNTRALDELFQKCQERGDEWRSTITVSVLEVYNEEIRDLMVPPGSGDKLDVKQGPNGNYVPGLTEVPVTSNAEVSDLLALADRNRSQTSTNMNEHSSRSHMMLTVTVVAENRTANVTARGKLNLVDLAGSERINKSGATGQALKEAQNINKSLSALGDVIAARGAKQAHVPFRNSTLTYLLQDSLSQDSKTLMFVCISPVVYNAEETFCSLNFAARVRSVELGKATKNVTGGGAAKKKK